MLDFIDNIRYSEVRKDFKGEEYIVISFYRYTDDSEDDILEIGMPKKRVVRSFGNFSEEEKDLIFKEVERLYKELVDLNSFRFYKDTIESYKNYYSKETYRLYTCYNSQAHVSITNYINDGIHIIIHMEDYENNSYKDISYPNFTVINKSNFISNVINDFERLLKRFNDVEEFLEVRLDEQKKMTN